jgi:hypothetical protein
MINTPFSITLSNQHIAKKNQSKKGSPIEEKKLFTDAIDSLKTLMAQYSAECFHLELSHSGYENESQESLYYDSLGILHGYKTSWNMEGTSGEEYYWFENGNLNYVYIEKYGQNDEPEIMFIDNTTNRESIYNYKLEINERKQRIYEIIKDNIPEEQDSNVIFIQLEETQNYGFEFIVKTDISIDKDLFDLLFK